MTTGNLNLESIWNLVQIEFYEFVVCRVCIAHLYEFCTIAVLRCCGMGGKTRRGRRFRWMY